MKVTMLSHASVLIEEGAIALYTDPWFMGQAFNESWSLINAPAATPADLHNASHIWISHEHPDHLHFPTLKAIPEEHKAKIILLYQEHFSSRICRALGSLGFRQVVELPLSRWFALDDETSIFCSSVGTIDSLLAVRSREVTVLNINDCPLSPAVAKTIAKYIGPVDVLLTQFSISSWVGNPDETDVAARHNVIARMRAYVNAFQPKILIPFANFAYFSHTENRHINRWINTPDHVSKRLSDVPCQLQFLYNGDSWSSQEGFSLREDPIDRYRMDFMALADRLYISHSSCSLNELIDLGKKLIKNVRAAFPGILLGTAAPIHFYVVDLRITVLIDLYRGVVEAIQRAKSTCDMALSSQALWYAFKFPWGFTTLEVSGRFELLNPNMNGRALYLCHLYCSDISFKGLSHRLAQGRVWRFLWAKRHELLDRLIRGKHQIQPNPL